MRLIMPIGALLLLACPALAQSAPAVAFGQVTAIPIPLQSVSGRFSSLNPVDQQSCSSRTVSGRVVSPTLILVPKRACGRRGQNYELVNVQLANPAEEAQMVPGRQVNITASFKRALEARETRFIADYVIAQKAVIVGGDPIDPSAPPLPAFTSYMICQPPELDALASRVNSDICVQNTLIAELAVARPALEAAAVTPSQTPPEEMSGDPNAIWCGVDAQVSDRHLKAIACARGSYWAWYKALRDPKFTTPAPP